MIFFFFCLPLTHPLPPILDMKKIMTIRTLTTLDPQYVTVVRHLDVTIGCLHGTIARWRGVWKRFPGRECSGGHDSKLRAGWDCPVQVGSCWQGLPGLLAQVPEVHRRCPPTVRGSDQSWCLLSEPATSQCAAGPVYLSALLELLVGLLV